jgi:hypothetical protein
VSDQRVRGGRERESQAGAIVALLSYDLVFLYSAHAYRPVYGLGDIRLVAPTKIHAKLPAVSVQYCQHAQH